MSDFVSYLRDFGLNLTPGRNYPDDWMVYRQESIGNLNVLQKIPSHIFSGYKTGYHQQTVGASGRASQNADGIVIEVIDYADPQNPQVYSEKVMEQTSFDTQQAFWRTIIEELTKFIVPIGSYKNTGTVAKQNPLNPEGDRWEVGDVVNVSRLEQSGGGLALGHVSRIYPIEVEVTWPADALHPEEWTTLEKKTSLIFVRHDPTWVREHQFSAETFEASRPNPRSNPGIEDEYAIEQQMFEDNPDWTGLVTPIQAKLYRETPMPFSEDVWGEHDALLRYTTGQFSTAVSELSLLEMPMERIAYSNFIQGFDPYTGTPPVK